MYKKALIYGLSSLVLIVIIYLIVKNMKNATSTSAKGLQFIAGHEGFKPYWYDDLNPSKEWKGETPKGTLTIGFGHTKSKPVIGQRITELEGLQLLKKDVIEAENKVKAAIKRPLSQNEFDALVSWAYNTGKSKSTLYDLVNANDRKALNEFWRKKYTSSKGVQLAGLVNRRKEENELFNRA